MGQGVSHACRAIWVVRAQNWDMGSVRLNFPMESLDQWGDRLGLSKARRRRIEAIVAAAEKKPARMKSGEPLALRCAKKVSARASRIGSKR